MVFIHKVEIVGFHLTLKGENANGSLQYYGDGRRAFTANGSGESGNWTAKASFTVQDDEVQTNTESPRDGDVVDSTKTGDQTVEVSNGALSLKLGLTTPLDTYRQGRSYLLMGADGDAPHVSIGTAAGGDLGALDNRIDVAQIGYKVGDAISVGLAIQQSDSGENNLGSAFGSIAYGSYGGALSEKRKARQTTAIDGISVAGTVNDGYEVGNIKGAAATSIGLKVNFNTDFLKVGFVYASGSEKADAASGSPKISLRPGESTNQAKNQVDNTYKASGTGIGVGVGLSLGAIKPYLNLWIPSSESEGVKWGNHDEDGPAKKNKFGDVTDAEKAKVTPDRAILGSDKTTGMSLQVGLDFALSDDSGVGFSYVSRSTKVTDTRTGISKGPATGAPANTPDAGIQAISGATSETETEYAVTTIELGYSTKLGSSNFLVGVVSDTISQEVDGTKAEVGVTWLRARLQQSF